MIQAQLDDLRPHCRNLDDGAYMSTVELIDAIEVGVVTCEEEDMVSLHVRGDDDAATVNTMARTLVRCIVDASLHRFVLQMLMPLLMLRSMPMP